MLWFLILLIPAVLIGHGQLVLSLLWYAGFVGVSYLVSLGRHGNRRCRTCGGSGRQKGAMFTWGDRICTSCGGQSRQRRWGTQVLYRDRRTPAEEAAAKARVRRGRLR